MLRRTMGLNKRNSAGAVVLRADRPGKGLSRDRSRVSVPGSHLGNEVPGAQYKEPEPQPAYTASRNPLM